MYSHGPHFPFCAPTRSSQGPLDPCKGDYVFALLSYSVPSSVTADHHLTQIAEAFLAANWEKMCRTTRSGWVIQPLDELQRPDIHSLEYTVKSGETVFDITAGYQLFVNGEKKRCDSAALQLYKTRVDPLLHSWTKNPNASAGTPSPQKRPAISWSFQMSKRQKENDSDNNGNGGSASSSSAAL